MLNEKGELAEQMRLASQGRHDADLVIKDGLVLNVFTNEFIKQDVAVCEDTIVGVGTDYHGLQEIDAAGKYLVPGYIDAHVHIESSMLTPAGFAELVLPFGTTTAITDPHEIANVSGTPGIAFMLSESEKSPMNLYVMLPSCVPATGFDTGGARLAASDLEPYRNHPKVLGLGEIMDVPGVLGGSPVIQDKLCAFQGMKLDGHAPRLSGKPLQAYRLAGITTDHECTTGAEAIEKLRAGFAVLAREGSGAHNLEDILQAVRDARLGYSRLCFCTDDKHADDILREGHISFSIRRAIARGLDPVEAYKVASWYPAQIYGLKHLGAVAAGYQADIVLLNSLMDGDIAQVYCKGKRVGQKAGMGEQKQLPPEGLFHTVKLENPLPGDLKLPIHSGRTAVIEFVPRQINTKLLYETVPQQNGFFEAGGPYRKAAVLERHKKTGNIGIGIVKGMPIRGAAASTVAHDSHNLVVIGDNDGDMLLAVRELIRCEGGYTIVRDGKILETIPLPIGGLMSEISAMELAEKLNRMKRIFREMGVPEGYDPFHTLSFLSLPVIPEARITDGGVFDAQRQKYLDL